MKKTVLTVFVVTSTLFAAKAGNHLQDKDKDIAVTSMGVTNGEMAFNLKYDNANEYKLSIVLSDDRGLVLYKEIIESKNINKTFKTSSDVGTVILTVTNTKDKTKQKFEISNEKRYVEELLITNIVKE
jgi:hypothetical protein